jgi:hypothetical protein
VPPVQVAVLLAPAEQAFPHPPQLATSVVVLTHDVPHSVWLQLVAQLPMEQN